MQHSACGPNQYVKKVASSVGDVECGDCVSCTNGRKHYWGFEGTLNDTATGLQEAKVLHFSQDHAYLRPQYSGGTSGGKALDLTAGDGYLSTTALLPDGPKTVSFYVNVKDFSEDAGCA